MHRQALPALWPGYYYLGFGLMLGVASIYYLMEGEIVSPSLSPAGLTLLVSVVQALPGYARGCGSFQ